MEAQIPIQQVFEDDTKVVKGKVVKGQVALKQFLTAPHSLADLNSKKLQFLANLIAFAFFKSLKKMPYGVVIEYLKGTSMQSVIGDGFDEKVFAEVEGELKRLLSEVHDGVYRPNASISLCKACAFKSSCPHSLGN